MRNLVIGLAVVALIGLAAGTALAAGPAHPKADKNIQLAAHFGPHYYQRRHRPYIYRPRVIVPGPPAVVQPPVYRYRYYGYPYYPYYPYYGPSGSFHYYGPGGGISIGW